MGFKYFACFTGDHKQHGKQTVLNYNGFDKVTNDFVNGEVNFPLEPPGSIDYVQDI
jgi:hypothetical protein